MASSQNNNNNNNSNIDQIDSVPVNLNSSQAPIKSQTGGILRNRNKNNEKDASQLNGSTEIKTKKPKNTALKQQRLPAWSPILTAGVVMPLFFIVGVIFVVLGSVLVYYSNQVKEYSIDYTNCQSDFNNGSTCASIVAGLPATPPYCTCTLSFKLDDAYTKTVYIYYGINNYYQNHRRYVKSRDDNQLLGKLDSSVSSDCSPFDKKDNQSYAPCGAIANSLFNDTYQLIYNGPSNTSSQQVPVLNTGIAWSTDKKVKFRNPSDMSQFSKTLKPVNWQVRVENLDPTNPDNTGFINEDLIVWMRTAALPNFRKLHRIVDHSSSNFSTGLPSGYYTVKINYNYPVTSFDGKKYFVLSTVTWIGGKNAFLGIAYLVIGSLCLVLGAVFLIVHIKFGKKINDEYNRISKF